MSWIKIDDQFADHPKVLQAGPLASWLYVCGLTYSGRYLTDGWIPSAQVRKLADVDDAAMLADRLVAVGLWEPVDGGYLIHDYHDYNPTAEKVKADRAAAAKRQAEWRDGHRDDAGQYQASDAPRNAVSNGVTDSEVTPAPSPSPSPITTTTPRAGDNELGGALVRHGIIPNGSFQAQKWADLWDEHGKTLFIQALEDAQMKQPGPPTLAYVTKILKDCVAEGRAPGGRAKSPPRASPSKPPVAPMRYRNPITGEIETVNDGKSTG